MHAFLDQVALLFPNLPVNEVKHPELDLISAVNKPDPERRKLLSEAKRLGYGRDCLLALYGSTFGGSLYQRRYKTLRECAEYMASVNADS